jgi:aspartyl protease family protein
MRGGWWRWAVYVAVAVGVAASLAWLADTLAGLGERDARIRFVYGALLLILLVGSAATRWRRRPPLVLRHLLGWSAIALVLLVGYSYRFEIRRIGERLLAELAPATGLRTGPETVSFRASDDGHFHVDASLRGVTVPFLVDTGASVVTLTPADARRIGLDPDKLSYSAHFQTANGTSFGAPVVLPEIRIGPITIDNVRAAVNRTPMAESLLGQSFLDRLTAFRVSNGTLTLQR